MQFCNLTIDNVIYCGVVYLTVVELAVFYLTIILHCYILAKGVVYQTGLTN